MGVAHLSDEELLRLHGDVFARDPATAELAARFADAIDDSVYLESDEEHELRRLLRNLVLYPTDEGKQREARKYLGLPPLDGTSSSSPAAPARAPAAASTPGRSSAG